MNDAPWGGSEVLWSQTAALALTEGHEVLITAYEWPQPAPALLQLVAAGATLFYRAAYSPRLHTRMLRRAARVVRPLSAELRAIQAFSPDLVFVNQGGHDDIIYKEDLTAWLVTGSVPYTVICHLYQDPLRLSEDKRAKTLAVYRGARWVFTISRTQTDVLRRQLADALPNARVVANPLNLPTQIPMPFPATAVPQLAVVASLDADRKGHDVLLQVLSAPMWAARVWQLNLYGQGPDRGYLERLVAYYGLGNKVVFHGHVADSASIWRTNHLLVIPSRIESGPMVLVEAMLSGRPVVSTDVGLVSDWLEDGRTGFVAEASLPRSLGLALERSWQAQAQWPAMGQLAHARALAKVPADPAREMLELLVAADPG
jgi:glycosyltransferase involved in cell wall biosynthesis